MTTVAHFFRTLRAAASSDPDKFNCDQIDDVERRCLSVANGARMEGPAIVLAWELVRNRIKPPRKLIPRIIAELKYWRCKNIKVEVASHYGYTWFPKNGPAIKYDPKCPFIFGVNISCVTHCGRSVYCRILLNGIHSDILSAADGKYDAVEYRIMYGILNTGLNVNEYIDRPYRVRSDIESMMMYMHDDVVYRSEESHEEYLIHSYLDNRIGDMERKRLSGHDLSEMTIVGACQEHFRTRTLIDGYVPSKHKILSELYKIVNPLELEKKPAVGRSPVIIHNELGPVTNLYDPNGRYVGPILNETALYDVALQIKNLGIDGYYIMFGRQKITIDSRGTLSDWPSGFYDATEDCCVELLQ